MGTRNSTEPAARTEMVRDETTGITMISRYVGSALEGEQQVLGPNGDLIQTLSLRDGKLHGTLQLFESGILRTQQAWQDGRQHGESRYYNADGNMTGMMHFTQGEQDGISEWRTAEGTPLTRDTHTAGKRHGEQLEFYSDGTLRKRSLYKSGDLQGEPEYFDTHGLALNAPWHTRARHRFRSIFRKTNKTGKEA